MRKGTFSVKKATANSSKHNSRENAPKYLIGLEFETSNYYELINSDDNFIIEAQNIYKNKIKQSMQKSQVDNLIQETVLTLKPEQNENDVKDLFSKLHKKYGGHEILELSVHRDEGHFVKDEIAYYPTKNILNKNGDWYICSDLNIEKPKENDFDFKVDISTFEKVYNYHAHVKFSMFDRELGKSARMQKKDMSERIKFVSDELGLIFSPGIDSRITKSVSQIKDEHLVKAQATAKEQAKVIQANATITELKQANAELRAELQNAKVGRTEYAQLEQLNKDLKLSVKNKDLTIEEMNTKFEELKNNLLKEKNEALESVKSTIISSNEEKTAYKQNIEELKKALMKKDDLIFGMKVNYGKLEKEHLISLNEMKPKEIIKTIKVPVIKEVENPINTQLQKENEELKELKADIAKVINIPVERNFFFLISIKNIFNALKEQIESLQEQIRDLTRKDITSQEKINPRASDDALQKILKQYEDSKHSEKDVEEALAEFRKRNDYR